MSQYVFRVRDQKEEIRLGLVKGLDVSIYAKSEYNLEQMREIRRKLLEESTPK